MGSALTITTKSNWQTAIDSAEQNCSTVWAAPTLTECYRVMRKSEIFDRCAYTIDKLLRERKLRIQPPISTKAHVWFAEGRIVHSGITVSTFEGQAGFITRAWGTVFVDPDRPQRCTSIHTSYYGESVALGKLLDELEKISLTVDNNV